MIISRTPFRISFFGGGTDYPAWYNEHGGAVLSTTIDKYCYLTCRYLPPFFEYKSRVVWSQVELVNNNSDIKHPAVRETLDFLNIDQGLEIHHVGDLPARTGLGTSSSFAVGLLHALYALQKVMPSKRQLAEEAIYIERDRLKENVGSQDQVSAAVGGLNRIDFGGESGFNMSPIIIPQQRIDLLQDHLMLFFTGFSRNASDIAEEQIKSTNEKVSELSEMYQMVTYGIDILSGSGDLVDFGRLLDHAWQVKRSLTKSISTVEIDEIYDTAVEAGAVGGKLLGAGGGGFVLLFVRPQDQERVKDSLKGLLHVPFRFESSGSQIIFCDHQTSNQSNAEYYSVLNRDEKFQSALSKTK